MAQARDKAWTELTAEQKEKAVFVNDALAAMLRAATGGYIRDAWLEAREDGTEAVCVAKRPAQGAHAPGVAFPINVTGDSLWAIAKDVMAAVAEAYEQGRG